ncbi:hypothetical protein P7K49_012253 [Saguinus oedipus]|uniref:Basic proline-rich protein-like n=1 Tax=Saguinus oedipus TaxID=9490 RepID=A0ABQ9VTN6_SAGOE|nr:hypothetical protein P7K49_012253 [Saguinus oedipus]
MRPFPAPRRRERKMPRDLPRLPGPPPRRPAGPATPAAGGRLTELSRRRPHSLSLSGRTQRRLPELSPRPRRGSGDSSRSAGGINPVGGRLQRLPSPISASLVSFAFSSGGCAVPSHPHSRRPWTGKTAGISLTGFWLQLRRTNLLSPGPPRFGDTDNSAGLSQDIPPRSRWGGLKGCPSGAGHNPGPTVPLPAPPALESPLGPLHASPPRPPTPPTGSSRVRSPKFATRWTESASTPRGPGDSGGASCPGPSSGRPGRSCGSRRLCPRRDAALMPPMPSLSNSLKASREGRGRVGFQGRG